MGNDTIIGDDGNDILMGSYGIDTITGGGGNDTFSFSSYYDTGISYGIDTITDFTQGKDHLRFEDSFFGNDWTAFNVDNSSGITTIITHSTLADFELHLTGSYTLTAYDFNFY